MNGELKNNIKRKIAELEERRDLAKAERNAIIAKFSNAEQISQAEVDRSYALNDEINKINEELKQFDSLNTYEKMHEELHNLARVGITADEKLLKKNFLMEKFNEHNKEAYEKYDMSNVIDGDIDNVNLDLEIAKLREEKRIVSHWTGNTDEIDKQIEKLVAYNNNHVNLSALSLDLDLIKTNKVSKDEKQPLIDKYDEIINEYEEAKLEKIANNVNTTKGTNLSVVNNANDTRSNSSNSTGFGVINHNNSYNEVVDIDEYDYEETPDNYTTRQELEKTEKEERKSNRLRNGIILTAVAGVCVLICLANKKNCTGINTRNNDNTNRTNTESLDSTYTEESSTITVEESSYSYESSKTEESSIPEFNNAYRKIYEYVQEKYEVPESKAVDYVNRSYRILDTKFFYDADIYDVIDIVIAIDRKEILTADNADLLQAIYNPFNDIAEKYLFGENTPEDVSRLEAIKYLAKEGSDLGDFYNRYGSLLQETINKPEDNEVKDEMYNLVAIYASSLNHYDNIACVLTDDEKFNEDAQVRDAIDYAIAYRTVIAPSMFALDPKEVEDIDGMLIEKYAEIEDIQARVDEIIADGYEDYIPYILRAIDIDGIDHLIQTGIDNTIDCGPTLTKEGE